MWYDRDAKKLYLSTTNLVKLSQMCKGQVKHERDDRGDFYLQVVPAMLPAIGGKLTNDGELVDTLDNVVHIALSSATLEALQDAPTATQGVLTICVESDGDHYTERGFDRVSRRTGERLGDDL